MKVLGWSSAAQWGAISAALSLGAGCKAQHSEGAPVSSVALPPLPATSAAPKTKPWFAGGFSGRYEAKLAPVEVKIGAPREWAADDGKVDSGPGKLTLTIDDEGMVEGSSEGALGASHANGRVEDDTLRVSFIPSDATALRGVLVATREGDGFKGIMQASSTDSLRVRSAAVELKKQPN